VNQGNATQGGVSASSGFAGEQSPDQSSVVPTSLVVPIGGTSVDDLETRVRGANLEFLQRVNDALSLPMQVLIEQRDTAYRELADQGARSRTELERLTNEHERFVSFLMEEQLANLRHVRDQLDATRLELQRAKVLAAPQLQPMVRSLGTLSPEVLDGEGLVPSEQAFHALRTELEAAFAEVDETRGQAARLQEERDEAIRATDDVRLELQGEIEAARDETFEVQTRLDALVRQLDDARDEARDEAMRLTEEIDDLRRQLDERTEEVRRLRGRMDDSMDEVKHSRPPPPGASSELDSARREIKWLRQQLIELKRKMSKNPVPEAQRGRSVWKPSARSVEGNNGEGQGEGVHKAPSIPEVGG
jgi:chromosome segregation ATPase